MSNTINKLRALTGKQIAVGVVAASLFGVATVAGVSHAAPAWKPTKQECNVTHPGQPYGQCVSEAAHNKNGYGG
jgi:hypothetical protein